MAAAADTDDDTPAFPPLVPLEDHSHWPTLLVCLDVASLTLDWKIEGKGNRWHSGRRDLDAVSREVHGLIPYPYQIEFCDAAARARL